MTEQDLQSLLSTPDVLQTAVWVSGSAVRVMLPDGSQVMVSIVSRCANFALSASLDSGTIDALACYANEREVENLQGRIQELNKQIQTYKNKHQ